MSGRLDLFQRFSTDDAGGGGSGQSSSPKGQSSSSQPVSVEESVSPAASSSEIISIVARETSTGAELGPGQTSSPSEAPDSSSGGDES